MTRRPRVCFVSTIAWPLRVYMGPHIERISASADVTLVATGVGELRADFGPPISLRDVAIARQVNPVGDLKAFVELWRVLRSGHFDCVHSIMPKAGLLTMLAGAMAGVPVRFHTFTGQVWATRKGVARRFLMFTDWLIARSATKVLADSPSQREFLIANRILGRRKIDVLGSGSIVGVNPARFHRDEAARGRVRSQLGISPSAPAFIFVGRLSREKGIGDLLRAFGDVSADHPEATLLLVGPDEAGHDEMIASIASPLRERIHRVDFTLQPELYLAASDVICLPSYREGFGSVLLEAAATGLPAIASRIYGISDAVVEGVTGLLHEPGNIPQLAAAMKRMVIAPELRVAMGDSARRRALDNFSQGRLTAALEVFYRQHGVI